MINYILVSTVNGNTEFEIRNLSYEQAYRRAESLTRMYGYTIAPNSPMRKDGIISMFGEENNVKIIQQETGLSPVEFLKIV